MVIEFILNSIKDIKLLYKTKEKYDEAWADTITEETYQGTAYCQNIIKQLEEKFAEIKEVICQGQTSRIAHEEYLIKTQYGKYEVSFTIDTFDDRKQSQLSIWIWAPDNHESYNSFLEYFKIYFKQLLLKDWEMCTWVVDEQSEYLGMQLYPLIFKTENKIRAFVNKVLTHKFGTKWMDMLGLEDIIKGYKRSYLDFKRNVPEFNNINDFLICSTAESLIKLMKDTKIFESEITLSESESLRIHGMLAESKANALFEELLKRRNVKVDIWEDIFKKYFDNDVERELTNFIKNRNHVAHNKLLTIASYGVMKDNFSTVETLFNIANAQYEQEEPSDELYETWNAEQEAERFEQEYLHERIRNETGIDILSADGIFSLFEDVINEVYNEIDNSEYFNYSVEVSNINSLEDMPDKQALFTIKSNVSADFDFIVYTSFSTNGGMGDDTSLNLWIEKTDKSKLLETGIIYHNGAAHEDTMEGYFVADEESYLEREELLQFIKDLKTYIEEDMNTIKKEVDILSHIAAKEGGDVPIANDSCINCGQQYISLYDDLYKCGYCINCGEENELLKCNKCEEIFSSDGGEVISGTFFCNYCAGKIEKE